jgi:hypothetical protein
MVQVWDQDYVLLKYLWAAFTQSQPQSWLVKGTEMNQPCRARICQYTHSCVLVENHDRPGPGLGVQQQVQTTPGLMEFLGERLLTAALYIQEEA